MKRFDSFGAYMFDLLFAPLKKGRRAVNQFAIFFRVVGREFDDLKAAIFRVRAEANVASASEVMLPVHGQDRDMPRLMGETAEAYRTRLSMKGIISEWGGTKRGILYALSALGYEHSYLEPLCYQDPDRWAEFIVFLGGKYPSGVNDIDIIHKEIARVKEGSSRVAYGIEERNIVEIRERYRCGRYAMPICGRWKCGQFPYKNNHVGYLLRDSVILLGSTRDGRFCYVLCGTTRSQKPPYRKGGVTGGWLQRSVPELYAALLRGAFPYVLSGSVRLSQGEDNGRKAAAVIQEIGRITKGRFTYMRLSQGEDNGKWTAVSLQEEAGLTEGSFAYKRPAQEEENGVARASEVQTAQDYQAGLVGYSRSGQRRSGQRKGATGRS